MDIRELIGSAVNSSRLVIEARREGPLERVAALGAAALEIAAGADRQNLTIAAMQPEVYSRSMSKAALMIHVGGLDDRDVIASELGPVLWHVRDGKQEDRVPQAVQLFVLWLRTRPLLAELCTPENSERLKQFATRVMHEWLSDVCPACGGSGKMERSKTGSWIRPRGAMQRNAVFRVCTACNGTRRAAPSHGSRARCIGLTPVEYDDQRWAQRFNAAAIWLGQISQRVRRPLTAQLERRRRRP